MRQLDELVLGDDIRKVKTCKECGEDIEYKEGKATCSCKEGGKED